MPQNQNAPNGFVPDRMPAGFVPDAEAMQKNPALQNYVPTEQLERAAAASAPPVQGVFGTLGQGLSGGWQMLKSAVEAPAAVLRQASPTGLSGLETMSNLAQPSEITKQISESPKEAALGMVPGGRAAVSATDLAARLMGHSPLSSETIPEAQRNMAEGAGQIATLGAAPRMGEEAPKLAEVAERGANKAALMGRTPENAVISALNKGKISKTLLQPEAVASVLPDVKRASPLVKGLSPSIEEGNFLDAVKSAQKDVWDRYMRQVGRHASDTVDGGALIADPMMAAIPEKIRLEHPEVVDEVKDVADKYRRPIPLDELERLRKESTAKQGGFFRKGSRQQYEANASNLDTAVQNAQASGFRNAINSILEKHQEETVPGSDLRQRWGQLERLRQAAEKQQPNMGAQAPINLSRMLGGFEGLSLLGAGHPLAALTGPVAAEIYTRLNNPDFMIRRAMSGIEPRSYPEEPVAPPSLGKTLALPPVNPNAGEPVTMSGPSGEPITTDWRGLPTAEEFRDMLISRGQMSPRMLPELTGGPFEMPPSSTVEVIPPSGRVPGRYAGMLDQSVGRLSPRGGNYEPIPLKPVRVKGQRIHVPKGRNR